MIVLIDLFEHRPLKDRVREELIRAGRACSASYQAELITAFEADRVRWTITADQGAAIRTLLFDPHDPEAIADAMHQVLTNEELRHRLIRAGRERCRQFSWERSARETLKVLEEAALNRSPLAERDLWRPQTPSTVAADQGHEQAP